ncbi:polysaccharide biosynthesis C-terminal domain-containing protein [Tamlana sp. 2_MG-2023]|uniref:lipopolysaccharide biosynthesis protein n=1 Tax=unclassified Tamlana TaxID=2614803 RepID=UPI0026E19BB9|nr:MULTISPECIES: polysaccharide biosynthesis C-terminal domain-containing protein [unclassified Tamlana]MDO6759393.1 polysaccharide biosynthesis C-terminal domain-containing protein [Tamlana sp. 2_MG-2023]MDO6790468.1 polysaccharide biosynthesis C-terminal domain-containing protein [Tamlana sp. 1_MG-2023]
MGVVAIQSFKNIISTYLGFFVGAINTLFLYTEFLSDEYYGMVSYMLSLAYVIMPVMALGMHNTLVKFYSSFKTRVSLNSFLTLMLFLPMSVIIPVVIITYFGYDAIAALLSKKNTIIEGYLWHTVFIAIALAYFEVFFAWAKVQMQTVVGNFMKEVFHRVGTMVLLFLLYFKVVDLEQFMIGIVVVYMLRMLVMKIYAFSVKFPVVTFKRLKNIESILKYSFLIIIAGSIATILLDVDKVMLGSYVDIKEIAYYSVAIFIAAVIAVPQRSMHQILMPLSAKYLNDRDFESLEDLYKRSSLNLLVVGGFIFLLIVLNINELYYIIPEEFSGGLFVVFIISISKLYDTALGSNNAILFNSDYYRVVLVLGVVLVILMIVLNMLLIPVLGINGAGLATFIAIFLYNSVKLYFVYRKFKMFPFTIDSLKISGLILVSVLLFYFWEFPFHPVVNIALKSTLVAILYGGVVYRYNFSEDISSLINRFLKLK